MEKTLDELKQEAKELGISFSPNIGAAKLSEKIENYYKEKETNNAIINKAIAKQEKDEKLKGTKQTNKQLSKVAAAKKAAMKTKIVTIIDNDQRENHLTTVVPVSCTNAYFDLGTKHIPLNTPVEVQQGFIDTLKDIKIPMHVKNPHTGQSKTVLRPRYTINFEDKLKKD